MPHDKTVAMTAGVMIDATGQNGEATENMLYEREREAFIKLAKTSAHINAYPLCWTMAHRCATS